MKASRFYFNHSWLQWDLNKSTQRVVKVNELTISEDEFLRRVESLSALILKSEEISKKRLNTVIERLGLRSRASALILWIYICDHISVLLTGRRVGIKTASLSPRSKRVNSIENYAHDLKTVWDLNPKISSNLVKHPHFGGLRGYQIEVCNLEWIPSVKRPVVRVLLTGLLHHSWVGFGENEEWACTKCQREWWSEALYSDISSLSAATGAEPWSRLLWLKPIWDQWMAHQLFLFALVLVDLVINLQLSGSQVMRIPATRLIQS